MHVNEIKIKSPFKKKGHKFLKNKKVLLKKGSPFFQKDIRRIQT